MELSIRHSRLIVAKYLLHASFHVCHPSVSGLLVDWKGVVTKAKTRMTVLLNVALRSAESPDKKVAQAALTEREIGFSTVMLRVLIHREQDIILLHLLVKARRELMKGLFPKHAVDLSISTFCLCAFSRVPSFVHATDRFLPSEPMER